MCRFYIFARLIVMPHRYKLYIESRIGQRLLNGCVLCGFDIPASRDVVLFLFNNIACRWFGISPVKKHAGLNDGKLVGNSQRRELDPAIQVLFMKPQFFIRQSKLWSVRR